MNNKINKKWFFIELQNCKFQVNLLGNFCGKCFRNQRVEVIQKVRNDAYDLQLNKLIRNKKKQETENVCKKFSSHLIKTLHNSEIIFCTKEILFASIVKLFFVLKKIFFPSIVKLIPAIVKLFFVLKKYYWLQQ